MYKNLIQNLFNQGNWFNYNKIIARNLGVESAIILGNLVDKHSYFDTESFFMLRDDIEFETALTPHKQRIGENILIKADLISIKPVKQRDGSRINYYLINYEGIVKYMESNPKNLKNKKDEKKEFITNCIEEVARLKPPTWPDQPRQQGHVDGFDRNNTKDNKTKDNNSSSTTTPLKEVKAPTPVKGLNINTTESKEYKELVSAYKLYVDEFYIKQPKDIMSYNKFNYKKELLSYVKYWPAYIGSTKSTLARGNTLDSFDKKHTAQIHVMIKHWNNFNKFAKNKIKAEKEYATAWGEEL